MAVKSLALENDRRLVQWCDRVQEILLLLVVFTVPLFFIILTRDQFELPKLTLLRLLTFLMLGVWAVRILAARRLDFRRTPLDLPILVWLVVQVLTTLVSVSTPVSWLGEYENFRGLLTVGNYVVWYYLAVNFLRTRAQIDRLLLAVLLAGLITTGYGIAQFVGIDFIAWNPTSIAKGRYFASLGNPNFLAAYLAMVMPLVAVFFLETRSAFRRVLLLVSFLAMFFCLLGTWSRGGFLGLVLAVAVMAAFGAAGLLRRVRAAAGGEGRSAGGFLLDLIGREKIWGGLVLALLTVLVLLSATFGRNHMVRLADTVIHLPEAVKVSRLHIWGPALRIIRDHPLLGTGLDTFKSVFPRYATPDFAAIDGANVASRTAHNEILQVLATQGVVGLAATAWLTAAMFLLWLRAFRRAPSGSRDRLILIGLLAAWTAYSAQNLFSFGVVAIDTLYWLLPALFALFAVTPEEQARRAPNPQPEPRPAPWLAWLLGFRPLVLVLVAAAVALLGWQALRLALADYAYNRGSLFRLRDQPDQTLAAFRRAVELAPEEVKYQVYLGLGYEEMAKRVQTPGQRRELLDQAIAAYHRSLRLNPTNAYYLGNLGRAYGTAAVLEGGRKDYFEKAEHYYREAIRYAPVTVLFIHNLGVLYLGEDKEQDFAGLLDRLAAFDPREASRLAFTAGNHYYGLNDLSRSETWYRRALTLDETYVEAHFNYGIVLAQVSGPEHAIPHWRRVLELKPDFEPAREMLKRYRALPDNGT